MRTVRSLIVGLVLAPSLLATCTCSRPTPPITDAATRTERTLPPPARPVDVLAEAHFGHPRSTVERLGRLVGMRVPLDLGLALGLGVDSSVLSAGDTHRPIDVIVTGTAERQDMLLVFTPASNSQLRPTLSGRFRFTPVAGLGERLDPRDAHRDQRLHCAVVSVTGTIDRRIVCTERAEALTHAGRWAAFRSAERADDTHDMTFETDPATTRRVMLPQLRHALDDFTRSASTEASRERRQHDRPPDFGDPEAVIGIVQELARDLETNSGDLRGIRGTATVETGRVVVDMDLAVDPEGRSSVARDARGRLRAGNDTSIAARIPTDAFMSAVSNTDPAARVSTLHGFADGLVRVLGARLANPEVVQNDLHELFAHAGSGAAIGAVRQEGGGFETYGVLSQTDGGVAARATLARIARSPWLRALQFGTSRPIVTFQNQQLVLRLSEPPRPRLPGGITPPQDPPTVALVTVDRDALVFVSGRDPVHAFAAVSARSSGPSPSVFQAAAQAPLVFAVDLARLASSHATEAAPVQITYSAAREGADVRARVRVVASGAALSAIRALMEEPSGS